MDLNKAMIIGRLTRDPEMRTTPQGINVTSFSVATNFKLGQKDQVEFHNVVIWRKLGEIANQYLKKGSQVYIEGRIQTRSWQGNDGQQKSRTEIIADNMIMLGAPRGGSTGGSYGSGDSAPSSNNSNNGADFLTEELPTINHSGEGEQNSGLASADDSEEITVEDIPF
jgi:single-strand DNA-binding protein